MTARYLLRMDDACPTMDAQRWQEVEDLLDSAGIKPIVAVVPDNQDPYLMIDPHDPLFWGKVRSWQAKGWAIAMHGYQHLMHPTKSKPLLPFYERSEFGGLPGEEQAKKIKKSWDMFRANGVEPTVWIAPAHTFDRLTLASIEAETPIRTVSDGIARDHFYEDGFYWIPQQLWGFSEKHDGLWTVCLHPNAMTMKDLLSLRLNVESRYSGRIVALSDVQLRHRGKDFRDHLESFLFWQRHRTGKLAQRFKSIVRG
jgi:hypothetical protein